MANLPANLIELDSVISTPELTRDHVPDVPDIPDFTIDNNDAAAKAVLCERCKHFDIQSFSKSSTGKRGYLLHDVECSAKDGCEFCSLLLESLEDVEKPNYFYSDALGRRVVSTPDLYVHMSLSENYSEKSAGPFELRANRLQVEIGGRYSDVKHVSKTELCLAADQGWFELLQLSILLLTYNVQAVQQQLVETSLVDV